MSHVVRGARRSETKNFWATERLVTAATNKPCWRLSLMEASRNYAGESWGRGVVPKAVGASVCRAIFQAPLSGKAFCASCGWRHNCQIRQLPVVSMMMPKTCAEAFWLPYSFRSLKYIFLNRPKKDVDRLSVPPEPSGTLVKASTAAHREQRMKLL